MSARGESFNSDKRYLPLIWILSVAIPVVVAILLFVPKASIEGKSALGFDIFFLPLLNACINSAVTVLLLIGYYFNRVKNHDYHKYANLGAFTLSALFLVSYVVYHTFAPTIKFGGEGAIRYLYFFILISHILLATTIVPLALLAIYRGLTKRFNAHKKITRWTLPIWLYVSITGVVVYFMISPYYPK